MEDLTTVICDSCGDTYQIDSTLYDYLESSGSNIYDDGLCPACEQWATWEEECEVVGPTTGPEVGPEK